MTTPLTYIYGRDKNILMNVCADTIKFSIENGEDLNAIAEYWTGGDFADALKLCMEEGLQAMLRMCAMDREIEDHEHRSG